jgi:hypothetical protein
MATPLLTNPIDQSIHHCRRRSSFDADDVIIVMVSSPQRPLQPLLASAPPFVLLAEQIIFSHDGIVESNIRGWTVIVVCGIIIMISTVGYFVQIRNLLQLQLTILNFNRDALVLPYTSRWSQAIQVIIIHNYRHPSVTMTTTTTITLIMATSTIGHHRQLPLPCHP